MNDERVPNSKTILEKWGVDMAMLSGLIEANGSLRGVVLGYVAEAKFHNQMMEIPGITDLGKDDDHDRKKKGDRRIQYRGEEFKIEVKSLQTNSVKQLSDGTFVGKSQVDASDRRHVTLPNGSQLETTCLVAGEFDVLVVNAFAFDGTWRFLYAINEDLPRSKAKKYTPEQKEHLLATLVPVQWPLAEEDIFTTDLESLLDRIIEKRQAPPGGTASEVSIIEEPDGDIIIATEN
ncbi:restriction endonuclease [Deinococcus sp. Leaf326]|uniref:restriction endonuclease n=1 Tax=Deinococcus sp. Leaf326 TaxID=1736338 RepID=UPI000B0D8294|nr:restriction endonuclease [Deinococcus sp. Leaf326]